MVSHCEKKKRVTQSIGHLYTVRLQCQTEVAMGCYIQLYQIMIWAGTFLAGGHPVQLQEIQ